MATAKFERLAPPLMHAFRSAHEKRDARERVDLRDEGGDRVIASRRVTSRSPIGEAGLRREVAFDMANLLNTTNLASIEPLGAYDAVRSSIINFGIPDLSHRTIDEHGVFDVGGEIEVALVDFEPRLARKSIRVRRDDTVDAAELRLRFIVKADLRADPIDTPIEFAAEVELDTGKIKIDRLVR